MGRLIGDRMSYRNHYMCSGEATSHYQSTSLSVSESVCLDVPLLLRNGEPQRAEILRDDSPWDWEGFRLKNIWIHRTVSWKIAFILAPYSTLAVNFILSNINV